MWEYENYTTDYPKVFQEKKYFEKKQYFKKALVAMKERLNQLLEEELQIIQEEYAAEVSFASPRGKNGESGYDLESTFTLNESDANDYDFT